MTSARLSETVLRGHAAVPLEAQQALLRAVLDGARIALCFHRVRHPTDPAAPPSALVIDALALDALVDFFLAARPRGPRGWLTISFDDGYADAVQYVAERAPRYPDVAWLVFVCPEKLVKRAGFRWDLPGGAPAPLDVRAENDRADLRAIATDPAFRLATVDECRALTHLPNVAIGNHTNTHFDLTALPVADSRLDIESSCRDFEALFGPTAHFAFPFGRPRVQFGEEHVAMARAAGHTRLWSTEPRPYADDERQDGVVLPRYPIYCDWPLSKIASFILLSAARWHVQRARLTCARTWQERAP